MLESGPTQLCKSQGLKLVVFTLSVVLVYITLSIFQSKIVVAVTPPYHGDPKPADFVIHAPWRVTGQIDIVYGYGPDWGAGTHRNSDHYALDFDLAYGDPVYPVAPGLVIFVGESTDGFCGYGNTVIIDHQNGFQSIYAHLSKLSVIAGQVDTSFKIGEVGDSGCIPINEHLHFSLRRGLTVCAPPPDGNCNGYGPNGGVPVVPEPILGRDAYEGFGLRWPTPLPTHIHWSGPLEAIEPMPDSISGSPGGNWGNDTTNEGAVIQINQPVQFTVADLPADTKEIRFTAGYENWSIMADQTDALVWRILARCWPDRPQLDQPGCQWSNDRSGLQYDWKPHGDDLLSGAPWLPSGGGEVNRPYSESSGNTPICISFDVFDQAGNVTYAPAGTQCGIQLTSTGARGNSPAPHTSEDNASRLIYVQPAPIPDNVGVALIIDATGSMDRNDPAGMRKNAAKVFIDAAQLGDKIAVLAYDTNLYTYAPLQIIGTPADRAKLMAAVDLIGDSGATDINLGLNGGFSELLSDPSEIRKAAILLTDGIHNQGSYDPQSHLQYAAEEWPIYTVGLGDAADMLLLQQIASETNGICVNDCLPLTDPNQLQDIYFDISQSFSGGTTVVEESFLMTQGSEQQIATNIPIQVPYVSFFTSWPGSEVSTSLISPNGRRICPLPVEWGVHHAKGSTYEIYTIQHPEAGQWIMDLYGTSLPPGGETVSVNVSARDLTEIYLPLICKNCEPGTTGTSINTFSIPMANAPGPINQTTVPPDCPGPPRAPSNLQAMPLDIFRIQLSWQDNSDDESGFNIYEGDILIATTGADVVTYSLDGLGINSNHCYRIDAANEYGNSLWTDLACAATDSIPITGTVSENGSVAPGIEILLNYYSGSAWSAFASTTTGPDGSYEFANPPPLSQGEWLRVEWSNNGSSPSRLFVWRCSQIASISVNPESYICDFDIDNMDMLLPSHGATVSLPYTFTWDRRAATTDDYRFILADVSDLDPAWSTYPTLGYVNSYTMNNLPGGFSQGVPYGWWLYVYGPDGYGISRYYRTVTFSNTGAANVGQKEWETLTSEDINELVIPSPSP